jgi:hypothetical protein
MNCTIGRDGKSRGIGKSGRDRRKGERERRWETVGEWEGNGGEGGGLWALQVTATLSVLRNLCRVSCMEVMQVEI